MSKTNKLFAAVLGLLLLLPPVAGCGSPAPDAAGQPTVTASAPADGNAENAETTEADYLEGIVEDCEGYSFEIIAQQTDTRPNFSIGEINGEVVNDALYNRDRAAEDLLNVTIAEYPYDNRGTLYTDVHKTIAAGDDVYDLIITSMADGINKLGPAGELLDMRNYPVLSLDSGRWCPSAAENLAFLGRVYVTTGPITPSYYTLPLVVSYNLRLAEDYGIGLLYDVVDSGGWTVDRLLEMTAGVAADIDGNGKSGEEDQYGWAVENNVGNALFASAGLTMIEANGDDGYTVNMNTETAVNTILTLSNKLSDKTNIFVADDFSAVDTGVLIFEDGRAMFMSINMGYMMYYLRDMEDDFGILPIPKVQESADGYVAYCNTFMPAGVAMPITNASADTAALVMETLAHLSKEMVEPAVYEMTLREKVARDPASQRMMDLIFDNTFFDMNAVFNFGGSSLLLRKSIFGHGGTYVSEYEKIASRTQAELDDMIALCRQIDE